MDDEWIDYYSNLENLEDYSSGNENKNPEFDFVKRKFNYWKKHYEEMKMTRTCFLIHFMACIKGNLFFYTTKLFKI